MWWYYNKFDSTKSLGYVTDVSKYHNVGIWSMDLNINTFYVQKQYSSFGNVL